MHKHIRTALATAAAVALTGGLLSLSTGSALAADSVHHHEADFNGDHIGDVAFSAGWATVGGKKGAYQFVALYGSANGLNAAARKTVSQNTTGVPGTAETNDGFGWVSAYGDFNADGYDDLATSARYEDVDGDTDGGTVMIMWGSPSGLTGGTTIADPAVSSHDQWGKTLAMRRLRRRRQGRPRGRLLGRHGLRLQGRHRQDRYGGRPLHAQAPDPVRRRHRPAHAHRG